MVPTRTSCQSVEHVSANEYTDNLHAEGIRMCSLLRCSALLNTRHLATVCELSRHLCSTIHVIKSPFCSHSPTDLTVLLQHVSALKGPSLGITIDAGPPISRRKSEYTVREWQHDKWKGETLLHKVGYTFCVLSTQSWKLADSSEARLNHKTLTDLFEAECTALQKGHKCVLRCRWQSGNCWRN